MDEIELAAEGLCHLGEGLLEPFVGADVALADEWAPDRLGQVAHPFFDPLALVGERQLRAAGREPLRDRPGDRAAVGDAEDEAALAVEGSGHEGAVYSRASNEGFARWALDASCR